MSTSHDRTTLRALGVALATGVALLCAAFSSGAAGASPGSSTSSPAARPTQVAVFGDSLAWETQPYYDTLIHADRDVPHTYDTFGGTAICDWFDRMRQVEATYHPQAVELEFSGNNLTPCMKGYELYTAAYYKKYRADTLTAIKIFAATGGTCVPDRRADHQEAAIGPELEDPQPAVRSDCGGRSEARDLCERRTCGGGAGWHLRRNPAVYCETTVHGTDGCRSPFQRRAFDGRDPFLSRQRGRRPRCGRALHGLLVRRLPLCLGLVSAVAHKSHR